jgi:hypothetical protein
VTAALITTITIKIDGPIDKVADLSKVILQHIEDLEANVSATVSFVVESHSEM